MSRITKYVNKFQEHAWFVLALNLCFLALFSLYFIVIPTYYNLPIREARPLGHLELNGNILTIHNDDTRAFKILSFSLYYDEYLNTYLDQWISPNDYLEIELENLSFGKVTVTVAIPFTENGIGIYSVSILEVRT